MKIFSQENQNKIRGFFEKTGVLFPKGKRAATDRRSGKDRRLINIDDYLVVGGTERRENFEMRDHFDRRKETAERSPLAGML